MKKIIYASNSNYEIIHDELQELRRKPSVLVFVPSSKEPYVFKERQETQLLEDLNLNLKEVISLDDQMSQAVWQSAIKKADCLYLHGGNPLVFLEYMKEKEVLESIKQFNGFVIGISAGAMLLSENIVLTPSNEEYTQFVIEPALNKANLNIFPHLNFSEVMTQGVMTGDGLMQVSDLLELSHHVVIDCLADHHFIVKEGDQLRYYGDHFYQLKDGLVYKLMNEDYKQIDWNPSNVYQRNDVSHFYAVYDTMEEAIKAGRVSWLFNLDHSQQAQSVDLALMNLVETGMAYQQADEDDFKSWLIDHPQTRFCTLSLTKINESVLEHLTIRTRYMKFIEQMKVWPKLG